MFTNKAPIQPIIINSSWVFSMFFRENLSYVQHVSMLFRQVFFRPSWFVPNVMSRFSCAAWKLEAGGQASLAEHRGSQYLSGKRELEYRIPRLHSRITRLCVHVFSYMVKKPDVIRSVWADCKKRSTEAIHGLTNATQSVESSAVELPLRWGSCIGSSVKGRRGDVRACRLSYGDLTTILPTIISKKTWCLK